MTTGNKRYVFIRVAAVSIALAAGPMCMARQPSAAPSSPLPQAAVQPADCSEALEAIRAKHDLPGMAAILVQGGVIRFQGVSGVRAKGSPELATLADLWHLGSCTKAMTATLCARMVERGELKWETTLGEVFPDLTDTMLPEWRSVTVEMLLTNTSGVPGDLIPSGAWGELWSAASAGKSTVEARRALLKNVTSKPPASPPGTKFEYSNGGFTLAGHIAETIANKPWETLMQEEVFTPLGMQAVGFGPPGSKDAVDQPRGHRGQGADLMPVAPTLLADNPNGIGPAGTVHASIADWGKFVSAHAMGHFGHGPEWQGKPYLKQETWQRLHKERDTSSHYAMGWIELTRGWAKSDQEGSTGLTLTHSGSNTMWYCVAWVGPEKDLAILVTTNAGGNSAAQAADAAASTLIKLYTTRK